MAFDTSLKLDKSTTARMREIGRKSESYDKIINSLINFYKKHKKEGEDRE